MCQKGNSSWKWVKFLYKLIDIIEYETKSNLILGSFSLSCMCTYTVTKICQYKNV